MSGRLLFMFGNIAALGLEELDKRLNMKQTLISVSPGWHTGFHAV